MYLNANNLCGHYVMKALLIKTLDWINSKNFNIDSSSDDGSKRCFLEVDLDCPEELHDYPLASRSKKKGYGTNINYKS